MSSVNLEALSSAPAATDPLTTETSVATDQLRRRGEVLVALGRRAIAAPSWRMLAYDAAALVAETLGAEHFGVTELTADRSSLTVRMAEVGQSCHDDKPAQEIPLTETSSLAGYALSVAQPVATENLSSETRFQDRFLRRRGLNAAVAMPLLRGHASYGALIIASQQPRAFAADELQYFETIAHLVSATIAHELAYQELENERRLQATLLDSTPALMFALLPTGQIAQLNKAAAKTLGFKPEELQGQILWNILLAPDELKAFQEAFGQLPGAAGTVQVETWTLTKLHERRRISWSLAELTDKNGLLERVLLTGIDVTQQRQAEAELTKARKSSVTDDTAAEPQPFSVIPAGKHSDRRQRDRRAFPYVQQIAPLVEGQPPENHQFRPMRCRDISPTGFSFFSPTPPDFQDLIVALGGESTTTYLAARVMHATIIERDNKVAYIVGCRYLSRAEPIERGT
jgi:PAS domain S-box-containing protein